MDVVKTVVGLAGTAVIAGWVAFSVSAPRNFENSMNDPVAALGGNSIAQEIKKSQDEARKMQCEQFTEAARVMWDKSIENGTTERDAAKIEELDRQVSRFCD